MKPNAPGRTLSRGTKIEGAEEAAMEEGLLEGMDANTDHNKPEPNQNHNRTSSEFAHEYGDASVRFGKTVDTHGDMRDTKIAIGT